MYHLEGGDGKPSKSNLEWQPIGTGPMAFHCSASLRCTGAALYSIFKHMLTPKRRRNGTWPLESDTLASKREGKLFNEDGSWWWLYISFLSSRHTALLEPVLTFVLCLSDEALRRFCVLTLTFLVVSFIGWWFWYAGGVSCLLNVEICLHCRTRLAG